MPLSGRVLLARDGSIRRGNHDPELWRRLVQPEALDGEPSRWAHGDPVLLHVIMDADARDVVDRVIGTSNGLDF